MQRREYQPPELVKLGPASKLTLGNTGCAGDDHCCKQWQQAE